LIIILFKNKEDMLALFSKVGDMAPVSIFQAPNDN